MKQKTLYIVLVFSLGLNLSLLGAMGYWWTRPERSFMAPALERPLARLPAPLRQKVREARRPLIPGVKEIRKELGEARSELYTALREQPPDTASIEEKMTAILQIAEAASKSDKLLSVEQINVVTPDSCQAAKRPAIRSLEPHRETASTRSSGTAAAAFFLSPAKKSA